MGKRVKGFFTEEDSQIFEYPHFKEVESQWLLQNENSNFLYILQWVV